MASAKMISDSHQIYSLPFYAIIKTVCFFRKQQKMAALYNATLKQNYYNNTTMQNHVLTLFNLLIYISIMHFTGLD